MAELTIAFWNRLHRRSAAAQAEYLAACPVPWDVLILCEVTPFAFKTFVVVLRPSAAVHSIDLLPVTDMRTPNGVAIFTRKELRLDDPEVMADDGLGDVAIRPERFLALTTDVDAVPLRVVGWHAPFAAGGKP